MRTRHITSQLLVLFAFIFAAALAAPAQTNQPKSLVTKPIDESQMIVLHGNTHPLATAEFDRGAAPASLPMENMLLVLKRSPDQETALQTLLRDQQDPSSPSYHKWLTPTEFGKRFGPSDQDISVITSWLTSHGFAVVNVAPGRGVIQFSGTAAQIGSAFHTSIHKFVVRGESHWANASDPQIPAALSDAIVGVNAMHNFYRKPMSRVVGTFSRSNATGEVRPLHSNFSFDIGNCSGFVTAGCFAVAPFDFATIYNLLPLWNAGIDGTGVTIGIVGDSNINIQDVRNFRSIFGLPAKDPTIVVPPGATDPGVQPNGDELESDLDIQWAGAVAKNANIMFVVAANPQQAGSPGVDIAANYILNLASPPPVMSESFGDCEFNLGTAGNAMFNSMWAQGATEGITIVVSTGDNGAPACDFPNNNPSLSMPASSGLQVSGLASTPNNIAVGGTDFDQVTNPTAFWNTTSANGTEESAKGYIPETTWNDSCTNASFVLVGFNALPEVNCNDTTHLAQLINPIGGSGGVSNCTNGANMIANCSGGNAKYQFQIGPGVPNDGKRDLPDVSLFAGDGLFGSFYVICEQDINTPTNTPCSLSDPNNDIVGVGGTSASAQAFAGVMALIVQKTNSRQGIGALKTMYEMAAAQSITGCNTASPANTCVFHDVTKGTISQPCVKNSPNCIVATSGDSTGILSGCDAAPGFDLATGLGTPNIANLVNNFSSGVGAGSADFSLSLANCTSTIVISTPGGSGNFTAVITEMNGFSGAYTFACSGLPSEATCKVTTSNIDATHISAQVTVSTTAKSVLAPRTAPQHRPGGPSPWSTSGVIGLALLLCAMATWAGLRMQNRKLSSALALLAFAAALTMAACGGGGGGGGGNAGTPTGTSTPTLTVTSGSTSHAMNFTLIVN